jgi:hypothetical protein
LSKEVPRRHSFGGTIKLFLPIHTSQKEYCAAYLSWLNRALE